jgi:hypothetical protein
MQHATFSIQQQHSTSSSSLPTCNRLVATMAAAPRDAAAAKLLGLAENVQRERAKH